MGNLCSCCVANENDSTLSLVGKAALIDFGIQWIMYFFSALFKTEKFFDLTGGSTFVLLAIYSLLWRKRFMVRQMVLTGMVSVWGLRLSSFLFHRILNSGRDVRFSKVRDNPRVLFIYWTIQGIWVFLTILPLLLVNSKKDEKNPVNSIDYLGWSVWIAGFLTEVIADSQKSSFRSIEANADKWIDVGLWSLSRHPNYLGEVMMWFGIFLSSTQNLNGVERAFAAVSPLFISYLLRFVSGVPPLEKASDKKWGNLKDYIDYKNRTPVFFPRLF